jgi:hypothetical protein
MPPKAAHQRDGIDESSGLRYPAPDINASTSAKRRLNSTALLIIGLMKAPRFFHTQNGGAVGNHRNQIGAGSIFAALAGSSALHWCGSAGE